MTGDAMPMHRSGAGPDLPQGDNSAVFYRVRIQLGSCGWGRIQGWFCRVEGLYPVAFVVGPRPVPATQFCVAVRALQAGRPKRRLTIRCGEGLRQLVQRAAHHLHVVRMLQVLGQGDLGRLVLQVTRQMGAAQPAAQALLGAPEGLFDGVVGAVDDRDRPARSGPGSRNRPSARRIRRPPTRPATPPGPASQPPQRPFRISALRLTSRQSAVKAMREKIPTYCRNK